MLVKAPPDLTAPGRGQENAAEGLGCAWHQEYGSWMLEGTPKLPYDGYAAWTRRQISFWIRDCIHIHHSHMLIQILVS